MFQNRQQKKKQTRGKENTPSSDDEDQSDSLTNPTNEDSDMSTKPCETVRVDEEQAAPHFNDENHIDALAVTIPNNASSDLTPSLQDQDTSNHGRRRSPRFVDSSSYLPTLLLSNNPRDIVDTIKSRGHYSHQDSIL